MENVERLTRLIKNGEKRKAVTFLHTLRKKTAYPHYAQAREKLLLVEVSKALNNSLPHFYLNEELLGERLFEENAVSTEEIICVLLKEVENSLREERGDAFKKATAYISKEYCSNQLSIDKVCEYVGVSQGCLIKLFKENKGLTPNEYLAKIRVEKSLEYLRENASVEKAALNSGFSSSETYIRIFKKIMGITPGVWKRNNLSL